MNATTLSGSMIAATLLSVATVNAQGYAIQAPYVGWGHYYGHASTYEEGVLRGWAAAARGAGQYNYETSLALINREAARSQYLDNRQKFVETYFTIKKINKQYRAEDRTARLTQEDYAKLAKDLGPDRLTASQYEPVLGKLSWPALLDDDAFRLEREAVDRLIAERTVENSGLGSTNGRAIQAQAVQMKSKLKGQIRTVSPSEYVQAKKFLTSLEYEAQLPLDVQAVAFK